ncbi:hypothetical protein EKH55_1692 [Sinorhizobium alkalisoli]|nr:hypothetical protein EKH55_1692 [Sinorhizobium alkalisoli]
MARSSDEARSDPGFSFFAPQYYIRAKVTAVARRITGAYCMSPLIDLD